MEPAKQALAAAGKLHDEILTLQEAVAATKQHGELMRAITRRVCISAPILKRLLSTAVQSNDKDISMMFTVAIDDMATTMLHARRAVFSWVLKNPSNTAPSWSSQEVVRKALEEAYRSLDEILNDITRLHAAEMYHKLAGIHNEKQEGGLGLLKLTRTTQQVISRLQQAAVEAAVGQLHDLLQQDRAGQGWEDVVKMAEAGEQRSSSERGQLLGAHSHNVRAVAWSPDGRTLATGSDDEPAVLWDGRTGKKLRSLKGHKGVNAVAWSPAGNRTLATGCDDKTTVLWDGSSGEQLQVLRDHTEAVHAVAWSPDGKILATGSADETARVWNVDGSTGKMAVLAVLRGHSDSVFAVAWKPDGKVLATGSGDKTVRLWNALSDGSTGGRLLQILSHYTMVRAVAWSPDGKTLASGSDDEPAVLWDGRTGKKLRSLKGHKGVNAVAWSPAGNRTLATGSDDATTVLWDGSTGEQLQVLKRHTASVFAVAFSADGRTLATGSKDNTVVLWEIGQ